MIYIYIYIYIYINQEGSWAHPRTKIQDYDVTPEEEFFNQKRAVFFKTSPKQEGLTFICFRRYQHFATKKSQNQKIVPNELLLIVYKANSRENYMSAFNKKKQYKLHEKR